MGVFDRFERSLERLVEGTFAKVFKDEAQPVDIAHALQRETDDRKVVVGPGRVIAPNVFVVELGDHDYERLSPYGAALGEALAEMVGDHARAEAYSFAGPIRVTLEHDAALGTGVFQVRSESAADAPVATPPRPAPAATPAQPHPTEVSGGRITMSDDATTQATRLPRHRIVISGKGDAEAGTPAADAEEVSIPLTAPVTVIGRSAGADVRLDDPGVSRRHAELRLRDDGVRLVDVGSTNGTLVNGAPVAAKQLVTGDRIQVGSTVLVYRGSE